MKKALLDTNIITAFLKGNNTVVERVEQYLNEHESLTISILSYYEILRGLKDLGSKKKLQAFDKFINDCEVEELERPVIVKAADIYVNLKREGKLVEDADILIAATAMNKGLAVVTDNEKHFRRIKGFKIGVDKRRRVQYTSDPVKLAEITA
ncbi:MAG: type II toxin-antitoxin system VapC family toxin [Deltaproteobacteria bacterium]|nr:type II toxin-antitoxin system VapC family toxin [Deltaproteobacteria bacterium]